MPEISVEMACRLDSLAADVLENNYHEYHSEPDKSDREIALMEAIVVILEHYLTSDDFKNFCTFYGIKYP